MPITRRPRVRVLVNGIPTSSIIGVRISSVRTFGAATFQLEAKYRLFLSDVGEGWADGGMVTVEVQLSVGDQVDQGATIWSSVLTGVVDSIDYEPALSELRLSGRDKAALLIDRPLAISYLNRTSSEIASALCQDCGLEAEVQATSHLVGQYYQIQHSKTAFAANSRHANAWDLLVELANIEGFDLWMSSNVLHFAASDDAAVEDATIVFTDATSAFSSATLNVVSLTMTQNLGLTRPISVQVVSWNSRQKALIEASYPETGSPGSDVFTITKPNILLDEAQSLARGTYLRLVQQGRIISCTMAGELTLNARSIIVLTGVGSPWDGRYAISRLERRISHDRGYEQHFDARAIDGENLNVPMA